MITKLARLEFELFTRPPKSNFYEFINFTATVINQTGDKFWSVKHLA